MFQRDLLLGLGLALSLAAAANGADGKEDVRRWVAQLGSGKYSEREAASRMLQTKGATALAELMVASREATDAEVRLRARALVRKIRRQLEDAQILAGQRLRLVYNDTPVLEAVKDFASKSGVPLMVEQELVGTALRYPPEVVRRRITLDTGETTFWLALEQFCRAAGLAEKGFAEATPTKESLLLAERERRTGVLCPARPYPAPVYSSLFLLVDAKRRSLPTQHVGGIRLRALPPRTVPAETKELYVDLDVMPDGGLRGLIVTGLTMSRAVDDKEQNRQPRPLDPPLALSDEEKPFTSYGTSPGMQRWIVPLAFAEAGERSAVLKELQGTLSLRLLAPRPLIRVDEVVGRAGETVRGEEGGMLQLLQAQREESGNIRLRLTIDPSASPLAASQGAPIVRVRPGFVALRGVDEDAEQFAVVDDAGRPWKRIEARRSFLEKTSGFEYQLVYQPAAGQSGPAHLVFSTTRPTTLVIPFRLREVPLR